MASKFNPDFAHYDPLGASRQALGPAPRTYGRGRLISGNFSVPFATEVVPTTVIVLCPIRSHTVLHSLKISNDDLDAAAGLVIDVGLCDKDGADINPGAADSRQLFDNASSAFQGAVNPSAAADLAYHILAQNVPNAVGAQIWERVNLQTPGALSEDPNELWFVCVRIETAAATPRDGFVGLQIAFSID